MQSNIAFVLSKSNVIYYLTQKNNPMSTSRATFIVNVLNLTNGYITFNGFPTDWKPDPVEHGGPPVITATIQNFTVDDYNSGTVQPTQLMAVSDCFPSTAVDGETQGQANFNMPDGTLLSIIWHIYYHMDTNNDNYNSITCDNYVLEYLQDDGTTYSTTPYYANSDVNTFTTTIRINEKI